MPGTGSFFYVLGPVLLAIVLAALALTVRWLLRRRSSIVDDAAHYGLLEPVADGPCLSDLEPLEDALVNAGIRSTVAGGADRCRLLVWPHDVPTARHLLRDFRRAG